MDERGPEIEVERLAHGPLDADAVDLAHGEDAHACVAEELALAVSSLTCPTSATRRGSSAGRGQASPTPSQRRLRSGRASADLGADPPSIAAILGKTGHLA